MLSITFAIGLQIWASVKLSLTLPSIQSARLSKVIASSATHRKIVQGMQTSRIWSQLNMNSNLILGVSLQGLVKNIGVSNISIKGIKKLLETARIKPQVNQVKSLQAHENLYPQLIDKIQGKNLSVQFVLMLQRWNTQTNVLVHDWC